MDAKTNLQVIIFMIAFFECTSAALLRTPKVYNALITTDQNLTPSRAYPVLQPSLHDPFFYQPYASYSPYSYYDPFGFNPFDSTAYVPKYNADGTISVNTAEESVSRSKSATKDTTTTAVAQAGSTEKTPIPLNEFGFPPSLIPLAPGGKSPVNLAPFAYNSYPLIYDQFTGFPQSNYLPHFGVLPATAYGTFGVPTNFATGSNQALAGGVNGVQTKLNDGAVANEAGLPGTTESPKIGVDSRSPPVATIAPSLTGLDGPLSALYGNVGDQSNPINFVRENGVSHGGISGNPSGVYGDHGIGSARAGDSNNPFDLSGNDDVNNGFSTAASNNAYGGVNSERVANRGVINESRLRGGSSGSASASGLRPTTGSNSSGGTSADLSNVNGNNQFSGQETYRSSPSSTSLRSQGQSKSSLSSGGSQGSFVSSSQRNFKV